VTTPSPTSTIRRPTPSGPKADDTEGHTRMHWADAEQAEGDDIVSEAMTQNTALVLNAKLAATAYVRQPPTVEVAPFGGGMTEFVQNQTLVPAEERLALASHHPAAVAV